MCVRGRDCGSVRVACVCAPVVDAADSGNFSCRVIGTCESVDNLTVFDVALVSGKLICVRVPGS
jgi:hypothetical protein